MSISWKLLKPKSKFLFLWIVFDPQSHNECPHNILLNAACVIVSTLNLFGVTLLLFSCSVVSNSLQLHRQQHSRLPCPLPSPRVCSNSYPLSWGCHPAISSSVIPSLPAFNLSQHEVFSNVSALHISWSKYWSFSINIQHRSFQWIFRIDFL